MGSWSVPGKATLSSTGEILVETDVLTVLRKGLNLSGLGEIKF